MFETIIFNFTMFGLIWLVLGGLGGMLLYHLVEEVGENYILKSKQGENKVYCLDWKFKMCGSVSYLREIDLYDGTKNYVIEFSCMGFSIRKELSHEEYTDLISKIGRGAECRCSGFLDYSGNENQIELHVTDYEICGYTEGFEPLSSFELFKGCIARQQVILQDKTSKRIDGVKKYFVRGRALGRLVEYEICKPLWKDIPLCVMLELGFRVTLNINCNQIPSETNSYYSVEISGYGKVK